jgi:hypothetical protein
MVAQVARESVRVIPIETATGRYESVVGSR